MQVTHPDVLALEPDVLVFPGEDDLPYDDGMPMETQRHVLQLNLLLEPVLLNWKDRDDFFVGGNMFVYYSLAQAEAVIREVETEEQGVAPPTDQRAFRGPDFFAVLDVPRRERKSWVTWREGKGPDVVIELLSASTARQDKGKKKRIYQDLMRVPEYFWYDPFSGEWAAFELSGGVYEARGPDDAGRLISRKLGLALTRWEGEFQDVQARWLRWETLEGELLPTSQEAAEEERRRADAAQQKAEEERRRADAAQQKAEEERRRADAAQQKAEEERQRADAAQQKAEEERRRADAAQQKAEEERRRAEGMAGELARYREILGDLPE